MNDYIIVTDSSANLPEHTIEKFGITVLSLHFYIEGAEYKSYVKGKETDLSQFYAMMRDKKDITTSLPSIEEAEIEFRNILESGKDIIYIGFSSGISGTYQALAALLEDLKNEYTDRKIYTVDTFMAALGEGILVHHAIEQKNEGRSIDEVYEWQLENRFKACGWFTVDDLFFLKRGGRVSAAAAVFGSALSIKPLLLIDDDGHLIPLDKARGRKKSLHSLIAHVKETIENPEDQIVGISHGDCLEDAEYTAEKLKEEIPVKGIMIRILDPVIGAHSGPGTVGIFYMGRKRQ